MYPLNPYVFGRQLPLRDDLIGEYLFENNFENSSDINTNQPTIIGTSISTITGGRYGNKCMDSNILSYGSVIQSLGSYSYYNTNVSISFSAWIYVTSTGLNYLFHTGGDSSGVIIRTQSDKIYFYRNNGSWISIASNNNIPTSQWFHLVCSYNSTTKSMKMYINNALQSATNSTSGDTTSTIISLGRYIHYSNTLNLGFTGKMDNIRIYKKELTQEEVNLLYNE